jgi:hypothetical protein
MKRSDIKLTDAQRIGYLKKNRSRLGVCLQEDRLTGGLTVYEANARHVAQTEMIELMMRLRGRGMTLAQLHQLIDQATATSQGFRAPNLWEQ